MNEIIFKTPVLKNKSYISSTNNLIKLQIFEAKIKNIQKMINSKGYSISIYIPPNNNDNKKLLEYLIYIDDTALYNLLINNNIWFNNELNEDDLKNLYRPSYSKQTNTLNIILSENIPVNIVIDNKYCDNITKLLDILLDNRNLKNFIINIDIQHIGLYIYSKVSTNKWLIKDINISNIETDKCSWFREDIENGWKDDIDNINNNIDNKIIEYNNHITELLKYKENINTTFNSATSFKDADKNWENKLINLKNLIIDLNNRILSTNDNR